MCPFISGAAIQYMFCRAVLTFSVSMFDESLSPVILENSGTDSNKSCMAEDDNKAPVARGSPTDMSNEMERAEITPPPQLSESSQDRRLYGHTLDITGALANNNILPRSASLQKLSSVVRNNTLFNEFPTRENSSE